MMKPSSELESATSSPTWVSARTLRIASLMALVIALGSLALVVYQSSRFDRFVKVFEDFDTELPTMTVTAMSVGHAGYLAFAIAVGLLLIGKEIAVKDKSITLVINAGAAWVGMVLYVFLAEAAWLPLQSLIFNVMGGR